MLGRLTFACFVLATVPIHRALAAEGGIAAEQEGVLLQTWHRALDSEATSSAKGTPVARVVGLLKEMQETLQKDMEEDEHLYKKLGCWCKNNQNEKEAAITSATAKIAELESTIKASAAKSAELAEAVKELNAEYESDSAALAESKKLREKQAKDFHKEEIETSAAIKNLGVAIMVFKRHTGSAFPQFDLSLLSVSSRHKDIPWSGDHESDLERSFGNFMRHSGLEDAAPLSSASRTLINEMSVEKTATPHFLQNEFGETFSDAPPTSHFLQKEEHRPSVENAGWSALDMAVVHRALKSASAFVQRRHSGGYYQSLDPGSSEILGVMGQLKEEMERSLNAAQKEEVDGASTFNEMLTAKSAEISNGEKMGERKEDELAEIKNVLAESKEDLDQTTSLLTADQKFMINLKKTCKEADINFEKRKKERLDEIQAVSEAIEILNADDARDTFSATYNFVQIAQHRVDVRRQQAAAILRKVGISGHSPALSILATSVELDAFTRVKKAIDDMIAQLKVQQTDEVKKKDWCKSEFHTNEISTMKATSKKDNLEVKISDLASTQEKLADEVDGAKKDIAQLQLELQRATENRKKANMDFQRTIAEQRATQEVLKAALEKLAKFYDFAQMGSKSTQLEAQSNEQTPPVPQMKYEKNKGASGAMGLIEKLIYEAKNLERDAINAETEDQRQYEALVADTSASVSALAKLITTKSGEKAAAKKETVDLNEDHKDTKLELDGLKKYNADLHGDCDYLLKNFDTRQEARSQEIEACQQAKSILSGATSK